MSTCTLRIELEGDGSVAAGTPLRGTLHVEVDAPVQCDGLTLSLQWTQQRHGASPQGDPIVVDLFRGPWSPGAHRLPFSIPVPAAPLSFVAEPFQIEWHLTAHADLPWKLDPSHRIPVQVTRAPVALRQRADVGSPRTFPPVSPFHLPMLGGIFGVLGSLFTYVGWQLFSGGLGIGAVPLLVGLGALAMGAWITAKGIHKTRQHLGFRVLEATVPADLSWPGEPIPVTVTIENAHRVSLDEVTVRLVRTIWTPARNRKGEPIIGTTHHTAQSQTVWYELHLTPGTTEQKAVELTLPPDAMATTCLPQGGVSWYVVLEALPNGEQFPLTRTTALRVG